MTGAERGRMDYEVCAAPRRPAPRCEQQDGEVTGSIPRDAAQSTTG